MANQISPGITWLSDVFALIRVDVRSFHPSIVSTRTRVGRVRLGGGA